MMKQTEIGLIPDDWEVITIGEVYDFKNGLNKAKEFFGYGVPIINYTDVYNNKGITKDIIKGKVYLNKDEIKRFNTQKGDVFFTRTSETPDEVGLTSVLLEDIENCVFSGFILRARPKKNLFDLCYCKYCFSTNSIRNFIIQNCTYTTRALTNGTVLSKIYLPLPPLQEQQRIAKALSDVDALISTTEKLIQKKKNIKQGTMQNLLTGKKRLPGFGSQTKSPAYKQTELGPIPEDWEVKSLGEFIDDFIVPMRDKPTDLTGPIPWCRIEDFDGKYLSESKTNQGVSLETIKKMNLKIFPLNTLLVSCSANLGKCAIVSKELITNQTFIGLVPNKTVNVEYLFYKMSFEESRLNEMATGTTISYLSREQFEKYEITTPPTKEEQSAIAKVLSSMDKEIETLNTKLEKYRNLKTAMMQQLLTGKIRLV